MFQLSRKIEYSLLALSYMSRMLPSERWVTSKEIADCYGIPHEVVARCLQQLARGGLVHSWIGAQGGYRLKLGWENKSLLELHEMLEGSVNLVRCLDEADRCSHVPRCTLPGIMDNLNQKFKLFYQSIVLRDIFKEVFDGSKMVYAR